MSTLKVNTISNNGTETDTPQGFTIASNSIVQGYTESASEPSAEPSEGDIWWDTTNSVIKRYVNGVWRTITTAFASSIAWGGDRALIFGGLTTSHWDAIEYITISTPSNGTDFGDLSNPRYGMAAAGSASRCIACGGNSSGGPSYQNVIEYVTPSTPSNVTDFGDLDVGAYTRTAAGNGTRALIAGGFDSNGTYTLGRRPNIEYITIATTGNGTDFGDMQHPRSHFGSAADATRWLTVGNESSADGSTADVDKKIEYVTIATTGNATTFGNLLVGGAGVIGASDSTRAIFAGGSGSTESEQKIEYVTVQTTGNATDFGELNEEKSRSAAGSNGIRATFAGTNTNSTANAIEYITIQTTGNGTDFGDLITARRYTTGASGNAS